MTGPWILVTALALAVVVLAAVALLVQRRGVRRGRALEERIARLEEQVARSPEPAPLAPRESRADDETTPVAVITRLGQEEPAQVGRHVPERVSLTRTAFADTVVRETVVQTAALAHGVRRALTPETLDRVRREMRRELRRARKDRKVEVREALREYRAKHRADVDAVG